MRLFVVEFQGVYLGGAAVAAAPDASTAISMLVESDEFKGLKEETVRVREKAAYEPCIVYLWNGDY